MKINLYTKGTSNSLNRCWLLTIIILLSIISVGVKAQIPTVLINGIGDGSFESGTFAGDGWTTVQSATNKWVVGTAGGVSDGTKAAYISNDNGATVSYSNAIVDVNHLYKDITLPPGEFMANFTYDIINVGPVDPNFVASLTVWVGATSNTPVAGTSLIAGTSLLNLRTEQSALASFTTRSFVINLNNITGVTGNTVRVIFSWSNPSGSGVGKPFVVDKVNITSVPLPNPPITFGSNTIGSSSYNITWKDNSNVESSFIVSRSNNIAGPFTQITTVTSITTGGTGATYSLLESGLTPLTTYYYEIRSVGQAGNSLTALTGNVTTTNCSGPSGTKTVGPGGGYNYPTLTAAFNDINTNGLTGPVTLVLKAGYNSASEPDFPITIYQNGCPNAITIQPDVSGLSITSSDGTATIAIDGGDNVTIDGRVGGTGLTKDLVIENTNVLGSAILFKNDATNDIVQYCKLEGRNNSVTGGVVNIGGTNLVTGTGNDNITIDNCDVRETPGSGLFPTNGIICLGTSAVKGNDNISVTNNNVFNYFNAAATTLSTCGILYSSFTNSGAITGNRLYQDADRSFLTAAIHYGIRVNNSSSTGVFNVSGNIIGTDGGSGYYTILPIGVGNRFMAIEINAGTAATNEIHSNEIKKINLYSNSNTTSAPGVFCGINHNTGLSNIGKPTAGNLIGSTTGTGGISIFMGVNAGAISCGIVSAGTKVITDNNLIGSITCSGGTSTVSHGFVGITATATTGVITNNTIGSSTIANSIIQVANAATTGAPMTGIIASGTNSTISNNTIANINNACTGAGTAGQVRGIVQSSGGPININGNTIFNLSTASTVIGTTSAAALIGIASTSTSFTQGYNYVNGNKIYSLSLTSTSTTAAVQAIGIVMGSISSSFTPSNALSYFITKNFIHSINVTAVNPAAIITGIDCNGGAAVYANNMIRLGVLDNGSSLTTPLAIKGIVEKSSGTAPNPNFPNYFYHNSVYIGGTGVGLTSAKNTFAFGRAVNVTALQDDIRNNIFVNNRSNTTTGGKHYALSLTSGSAFSNINNNIYQWAGTGGLFALSTATDVASYSSGWVASDVSSFNSDPKFLTPNGTSATVDLHIDPSIATNVEGNGAIIPSVTNDYDNDTRSAFTPVDIGADAGNFTAVAVGACVAPNALSVTSLTDISAVLNWNLRPAGTGGYNVRYKKVSDPTSVGTWATPTHVATGISSLSISGLAASTVYEFQVETDCSGSTSGFSSSTNFTTSAALLRYSVARTTGNTYNSIMSTGSVLSWGATSTDDQVSNVMTIPGSTFIYQGMTVTGFRLSTNGYIALLTTTQAPFTSNASNNCLGFPSGGLTFSPMIVAPFWDNLATVPNDFVFGTLDAHTRYKISPDAVGSRKITIEWANYSLTGATGGLLNFQVVLDESDKSITFNYGLMQGFNGTSNFRYSYSVGMSGLTSGTIALPGEVFAQQYENTTAFSHENVANANSGANAMMVMPDCYSTIKFTPGTYAGYTPPAEILSSGPLGEYNDESSSPIFLNVTSNIPSDLCGSYYNSRYATPSADPLCIANTVLTGNNDDDVWFYFTAVQSITKVRAYGSGGYMPRVQILDENFNAIPTQCAAATAAGTYVDLTIPGLATGHDYYVRVYHDGGGVQATATAIVANGTVAYCLITNPGTGYTSTTSGTPATQVNARVKFSGGGGSDAVGTAVLSGNSVLSITMNNVGHDYTSAPTVTIEKPNWAQTGEFALIVYSPAENDDCITATELTGIATPGCNNSTNSRTNNTLNATASSEAVSCGLPDDDVWYKFTADKLNATITVTGTGSFDPAFWVYDGGIGGDCATKTSISCVNANTGAASSESSVIPTVIGNVYYVRVFHAGTGTVANSTFTICVSTAYPACIVNPTNPPNGGNACTSGVTLSWPVSTDATGYLVYVDAGGVATTLVATNTGNTNNTYTIPATLATGTWSWRVEPTNLYGPAPGCNTWTFNAVNPPSVSLAAIPASASYCTSGSVQLTASGTAANYIWSPATSLNVTTGSVVNANPAVSTRYTVTAFDVVGCAVSAVQLVNVNMSPLSPTTTNYAMCANGTEGNMTASCLTKTTTYTVTVPLTNPGTDETSNCPGANVIGSFSIPPLPLGATLSSISLAIPTTSASFPANRNLISLSGSGIIGGPTACLTGIPCEVCVPSAIWTLGGGGTPGDVATVMAAINPAGGTIVLTHSTDFRGGTGPDAIWAANATFIYTVSISTNVTWWDAPTGGTQLFAGPTFNPVLEGFSGPPFLDKTVASNNTYYARCVTDYCESVGVPTTFNIGSPLTVSTTQSATGTACAGIADQLNAIAGGGALPYSYSWSPTTALSNPTIANPIATPATTTTYTVTVLDACSSPAATSAITVSVNPVPAVAVTPTSAISCSTSPTAAILTASGALTYKWAPATALNLTTGSVVTSAATSALVYTVTGTASGTGCTATATATIILGPAVSVTPVATPAYICTGGTSQLNATGQLGSPVAGYSFGVTPSGAGPLPMTSPTQITSSGVNDSPVSSVITFGFGFPYQGVTYTAFSANANGLLRLGATAVTTVSNNVFTATSDFPKIIPMWDDQSTGTNGGIFYEVQGTLGSRRLLVEWHTTTTNVITNPYTQTYQAVFYEGTGVIEYRYGSGNSTGSSSTGLGGTNVNDFLSVTTSAGSGTTSSVTPNVSNQTWPGSGTMYTFTPPPSPTLIYSWSPATSLSSTTGSATTASTVAATTTYTVLAVDPAGGCTARSPVTLSVASPITATISAIPSTLCLGQSTTITSAVAGGGQPYTYTWAPANGLNQTTGSSVIATPTTTTIYTLTVLDACSNTKLSNALTITVNPLPSVSVTSPQSPIRVCGSGSVTLNAAGANTYSWAPSDGLNSVVASTVAANPVSNTTYTVTGTSVGCSSSASITVLSSAPILINASANAYSGCDPFSTQLHAVASRPINGTYTVNSIAPLLQSTNGFTSVTIAIDGNTGPIPIPFNFNFYGTLYSKLYINGNAAVSFNPTPLTAGAQSLPNTIAPNNLISLVWGWVRPDLGGIISYGTRGTAPNRLFVVDYNNVPFYRNLGGGATGNIKGQIILHETTGLIDIQVSNVDHGSNAVFSVIGIENADGTLGTMAPGRELIPLWNVLTPEAWQFTPTNETLSYSWLPASNLDNPASSDPLVTNLSTSTIYTVSVFDVSGCSPSATVSLTVLPKPIAPPVGALGATVFCTGGNVTLVTTPLPNADFVSYSWAPAAGLNVVTGNSVVATPTVTTTYTVTGYSANGCSNSSSILVTVATPTTPAITWPGSPDPAALSFCDGQNVTLTVAGAYTSYDWSPAAGLNTTTGAVVIASAPGTYTVTVSNALGCTSTNSVVIVVNPNPVAPTVTAVGSTTICDDGSQSVLLDATIVGSGLNYLWNDFNGATTEDLTVLGNDITFAASGNPFFNFELKVIDPATGCYAVSNSVLVTTTYCGVVLNMKMYIQGFYSGGGLMALQGVGCFNWVSTNLGDNLYPDPNDVDDVTITAMDASTYLPVESKVGRLKTNGDISVTFTGPAVSGTPYFLQLTHRNLVETWSKSAIMFTPITTYDFTTASTQAWDDGFNLPMKQVSTSPVRWACYNGDIDHDGGVLSLDMTIEEIDSNGGVFGYQASDLNGDGGSDSLDMTIIENNGNAGVFTAHP